MNNDKTDTHQARWARFRFSIVGPLLSAPPSQGELRQALVELSKKQWKHPITGVPVDFSISTLERWYYQIRRAQDPVTVLRSKRRSDADLSRVMKVELKQMLQQQYREHPRWSYQLHVDNLRSRIKQYPELGTMPSYPTIRRYMKANGFCKQRFVAKRDSIGALIAEKRLAEREVRSFEVEYVHGLWHLDFHHGSRKILDKHGQWVKPKLLAIMDDHSRLICHAQWYWDETAESLVHGVIQALQKRGLPRAILSDNGSAMISDEFTEGLERLSILHELTLPLSPYQNGKQEVIWGQIEGRLMAMLENEPKLSLSMLNEATLAWIEMEYHHKLHSEIAMTPMERYLKGLNVGRPCLETDLLKKAFCAQTNRKQRKSDGTFTLKGCRFEVPQRYHHFEVLCVRYAQWDLSQAILVDPKSNTILCTVYPQDKTANASGLRQAISGNTALPPVKSTGMAPLLKELLSEYAATGLPPAYLPKGEVHE